MAVLASINLPLSPALFTALVATMLVLMALRSLASEVDHARRVHKLQGEVKALREKQAERLRNMLPRRR